MEGPRGVCPGPANPQPGRAKAGLSVGSFQKAKGIELNYVK